MYSFTLMLKKSLTVLIVLSISLLASTAMADIMNGEFDGGPTDWNPNSDLGLGISFPAAGGNPGAYALLESAFSNTGGSACIMQTFICGDPSQGTECTIGFDYFLNPIDAAPGTARLIVIIDGITSVVVDHGTQGWNSVSYVVPCGSHTIQFCLVVDPENNAWQAGIDNVQSECTGGVPNETFRWNSIKSIYR